MSPITLISWNLNRQLACWRELANDAEADVALLQEAQHPLAELGVEAVPGSPDWWTGGSRRDFCTAVARLSDRVSVRYLANRPLNDPGGTVVPVSLTGSIACAQVSVQGHAPVTVASLYCAWESPACRCKRRSVLEQYLGLPTASTTDQSMTESEPGERSPWSSTRSPLAGRGS